MNTTFADLRRRLAKPNAEILCHSIILRHRCSHSLVLTGAGRLTFPASGQLEFELQASLTPEQTLAMCRDHLGYAYQLDGLEFFATGYDGMAYFGSITAARLAQDLMELTHVQVTGTLRVLQTQVLLQPGPARAVVVYVDAPRVPLTSWRTTEITHEGKQEFLRRQEAGHRFSTAGTEVSVLVHKDDQELELSAVAGKRAYAHPHLEHLLIEPFRVLNGTDQCPRYILRDFGKGEGFLTIVPQHKPVASLGGACATFNLIETAGYWGYFGKYLDFIATTYDETLYADPNQLTLYHDEVNRAVVGGSYWIVSLALSSAVEGLCRMHPAWATTPSPVTPEERKRAEEALALLEPGFLQDKLRGALNGACTEQRPQGSPALKVLMAEAVIESRHKKSWESFRHYVAHGNLLDHREPDRRLECFPDLYELFQLLTAERISFSLEDYPLSEGGRMMLENYQNRADKRLL